VALKYLERRHEKRYGKALPMKPPKPTQNFSKLFSCGCCENSFPELHKHTHHKKPKALGGKDTADNLIELCPGCHDALHNIAWKLTNKNHSHSQVIDTIHLIYKDNNVAKQRCLDLAVLVRDATIAKKEKVFGSGDPNDLINIGTSIRKHFKPMIQNRYRELKISQEAYIRGLIITDIAKRFNLPLNLVEENRLIKQIKKGRSHHL